MEAFVAPIPKQIYSFELVSMVLLFPLGGENVEISWLLKKPKISRRDSGRKNSFKLTTTRKLIFHLHQNPNIIWCQDVQHGRIEVLVRNFLGQVIGFLHLLCSEVLWSHLTFVSRRAWQAKADVDKKQTGQQLPVLSKLRGSSAGLLLKHR